MTNTKTLKEQIEEIYIDFQNAENQMYQSNNLDELKMQIDVLNQLYDDISKLLNKLRKEQNQCFKLISKDIISTISRRNLIIIENLERLDSNYDYERGVLEENED